MRPLLFLGIHTKGKDQWTVRDRILAQGIELYDRSLTESGLPTWIAYDPASDLVLDEVIDHAAALLEKDRKANEGAPQAPGLRTFVVDQRWAAPG